MEVVAAVAPVAPLPLAQAGRDVAVVVGVVLEADRNLPAHVRLPVEWAFAGLERGDVQRAADATCEPGPVQEDAGIVDQSRDRGRLSLAVGLARNA